MEPQLHMAQFYFFEQHHYYKVMFVTFEDDTFAVYVFAANENKEDKYRCIGSYDTPTHPEVATAYDFLMKTIKPCGNTGDPG